MIMRFSSGRLRYTILRLKSKNSAKAARNRLEATRRRALRYGKSTFYLVCRVEPQRAVGRESRLWCLLFSPDEIEGRSGR